MIKRIIFIVIAFTVSCFAQNNRILSMGDMTLAIADSDYSLNLYDFGDNPSWLLNDEHQAFLKITPSFNRTSGNYKRMYDFGSADRYGINFRGIKPLGENGTFLGYTRYNYDRVRDVFRALKHDPYSGEAFLPQDSSTGDFRYNGPAVGFTYSYKIVTNLYFGANIDYQILDGLKDIYSNVKSILRNVNGRFGMSYRFSKTFIAGLTYGIYDTQETLEMASVDGTDVQIMNYRGDTYATLLRSSSVTQKIKRKGNIFGVQTYFIPGESFELALKGDYDISGARALLPSVYIKEFEEGYSNFERYGAELKTRYKASENLLFGISISYGNQNSWSKNSARDLLLWKWNTEAISTTLGCSYYLREFNLLLGMEYEFTSNKADSSKYIDIHFVKVNSLDNNIRIGAEYTFTSSLVVRAGYGLGLVQHDMLYGGSEIKVNYLSFGCGYKPADLFEIDFCLLYGDSAPGNNSNISRENISLSTSVKIFSF